MNKHAPLRTRGFTLIEVMIALALVGILVGIALPSYRQHLVKSARAAAQAELIELQALQEKIYLNSNAYTTSLTANYNGKSDGGLGRANSQTTDGKYTIALVGAAQSYTLTATPVSGSSQANDGAFSVASNGTRTCDTAKSWCAKGTW